MKRLLVLLVCGCSAAPAPQSDWERRNAEQRWNEESIVMPPYPARGHLIEFAVSGSDGFRFFIDGASLSAGNDGVVRYVLVARSPQGAENVSFEGIRCNSAEYRIYAVGRAGDRDEGSWSGRPGDWRPIAGAAVSRWHTALQREYFCPQNEPIRTAAEGVQALQRGGHPFSKGFAAPHSGR